MPGIGPHEAEHLGDAAQVHARRDIDQHQRGEDIGIAVAFGVAFGEQRSDAAEGGADRDRLDAGAAREFGGDDLGVVGKVREFVGTVRDPVGVAMAALIEGVCHMALARDLYGGLGPGVAGWPPPCSSNTGEPLSPKTSATSLLPAAPMKVAVAGVGCRVMVVE